MVLNEVSPSPPVLNALVRVGGFFLLSWSWKPWSKMKACCVCSWALGQLRSTAKGKQKYKGSSGVKNEGKNQETREEAAMVV